MNRRGFFGSMLAALAASKAPKLNDVMSVPTHNVATSLVRLGNVTQGHRDLPRTEFDVTVFDDGRPVYVDGLRRRR